MFLSMRSRFRIISSYIKLDLTNYVQTGLFEVFIQSIINLSSHTAVKVGWNFPKATKLIKGKQMSYRFKYYCLGLVSAQASYFYFLFDSFFKEISVKNVKNFRQNKVRCLSLEIFLEINAMTSDFFFFLKLLMIKINVKASKLKNLAIPLTCVSANFKINNYVVREQFSRTEMLVRLNMLILHFAFKLRKLICQRLHEQQRPNYPEKTAQKWLRHRPEKETSQDSLTALNIRVHSIIHSQAQIIIPRKYADLAKITQILSIESGKKRLLAQVTRHSTMHNQAEDGEDDAISVLNVLADLYGISYSSTGVFKGEIRPFSGKVGEQCQLSIVEFLVKQTYFSRRDQFKVHNFLRQNQTHVYSKKTIYFDELSLEVTNMLRDSISVCKTGIIDRNTKLIFRTNCSKYTIAVEISVQTFQLNQAQEIYLQKMVDFIELYLHRNNHFNNQHRIVILLYARLFYPQFSSLEQAYQSLLFQQQQIKQADSQRGSLVALETNFATAFQRDHRGFIYQDAYRRVTWPSGPIDHFREHFWRKISEFVYTINWDFEDEKNVYGKFIASSILQVHKYQRIFKLLNPEANQRLKPYLCLAKCRLSPSVHSNILQAISLISEQYKHHYELRSLTETGNAITVLSAGDAKYEVEKTTFMMAKSYVYLTNISCLMVNLNKKSREKILVNLVIPERDCIFKEEDVSHFSRLENHCIEKQLYLSPNEEKAVYLDMFESKSKIAPEDLRKSPMEGGKKCSSCGETYHYKVNIIDDSPAQTSKMTEVDFIKLYHMDDSSFRVHQQFYDTNFNLSFNISRKPQTQPPSFKSELDGFEADLCKIVNLKKDYFHSAELSPQIDEEISLFLDFIEAGNVKSPKDSQQEHQFQIQKQRLVERINSRLHSLQCQAPLAPNLHKEGAYSNRSLRRTMMIPQDEEIRVRKGSMINLNTGYSHQSFDGGDEDINTKVNIFEATFNNREYFSARKKEKLPYANHDLEKERNNFLQSRIHYLNSTFTEATLRKFTAIIQKDKGEVDSDMEYAFELQKQWKNICFPLLAPIFTQYQPKYIQESENILPCDVGDSQLLENEICKLLMKNYQLHEPINFHGNFIKAVLSKGHVSCRLNLNETNLSRIYVIDQHIQNTLVPRLYYKYLCYEEKDSRFISKFIYFKDKNYYDKFNVENGEVKSVKIVFMHGASSGDNRESSSSSSRTQETYSRPIKEFVRMFNDRYKEFVIEVSRCGTEDIPRKKRFVMNFNKKEKVIYHNEQIIVEIDLEYNQKFVYTICVLWNYCSSVLVKQFVENIITMSRRSKLIAYLTLNGNIFEMSWNISTFGEIVFKNKTGVQLLERFVLDSDEWLWDPFGYFMDIKGSTFLKINKEKLLVLWRNNNELKSRPHEENDQRYMEFFKKAAIFDIIGALIEESTRTIEAAGQASEAFVMD